MQSKNNKKSIGCLCVGQTSGTRENGKRDILGGIRTIPKRAKRHRGHTICPSAEISYRRHARFWVYEFQADFWIQSRSNKCKKFTETHKGAVRPFERGTYAKGAVRLNAKKHEKLCTLSTFRY